MPATLPLRPVDRRLLAAAKAGDAAEAAALLAAGGSASASCRDPSNMDRMPLHEAAAEGHVEVVELLLQAHAPVNALDKNQLSPLMLSVLDSREQVVPALLGAGADPNTAAQDGSSALFFACGRANLSIVNALLNAGASCSAANSDGQLPAHFAAQVGSVPVLQALAAHGASLVAPEDSGFTPLHFACKFGQREAARWLLENGALSSLEARAEGQVTPLIHAAEEKQFHMIPPLLEAGADPAAMDTAHWQPLHFVALSSEPAAVQAAEALLQAGAPINEPNQQGRSPLLVAANEGSLPMVELLVERGADLQLADLNGSTALLAALHTGQEAIARVVLNAGANVLVRTHYGSTPLLFGCIHDVLVPELLSRGAAGHINYADSRGLTPLNVAAGRHPHLVPLLLQHGADLRATESDYGRSALYMAAGSSDPAAVDAVRRLLDQGAQIDGPPNQLGQTPLHIASEFGNTDVVRLLLERGHPVNVFAHSEQQPGQPQTADEPRTPLHMAVLKGNTDVVDLLLQHGARFEGVPLVHVACEVGDAAMVRSLLATPEGRGQVAALDQFQACPLYWAAKQGHLEVARALIEADPVAAAASCGMRGPPELTFPVGLCMRTPIDWALCENFDWPMAQLLIRTGGGNSTEVLEALDAAAAAAPHDAELAQAGALFADVAASRPLSEDDWGLVPAQAPGLAAALPAVLARSREEAAHLVHRLPQDDQGRLQAILLSLSHACRLADVELPHDVLATLLAAVFGAE